ncbi:DUF3077 domain-containing protein [Pseudomonas putida]|uniref:DUF3077 domain-containing protein n=1 Tax=Pseudomonas putida TaxID=303 RepID=UPI001EF93F40|nr:DUF3077 domain-containing protein [Pseudomonas putida]
MTKGLPDPPTPTTAPAHFGSCEGSHRALFAVCAGVAAEDALVHLSTLLKGVSAANQTAMELATGTCRDLLLNNDHGLDACKALVESLLEGLEQQVQG